MYSFTNDSAGKKSTYNAGGMRDVGLTPESGKSPGDGNGNPLQHSFAWKILWTEAPDRLQSNCEQLDTTDQLNLLAFII